MTEMDLQRTQQAIDAATSVLKSSRPNPEPAARAAEYLLRALPAFAETCKRRRGVTAATAALGPMQTFFAAVRLELNAGPVVPGEYASVPEAASALASLLPAVARGGSVLEELAADAPRVASHLSEFSRCEEGHGMAEATAKGLPSGEAESGIHVHVVSRPQLVTHEDGRHKHYFHRKGADGDFEVWVTEVDGAHAHSFPSPDATLTDLDDGSHAHALLGPDNEVRWTREDGVHAHGIQVENTDFSGVHVHVHELDDGTVLVSLTPAELWRLFGSRPSELGDSPPAPMMAAMTDLAIGALCKRAVDEGVEVIWKAEPPTGTLPALKLPDPQFNIARLRAGEPSGFFSRVRRVGRAHKPQALVNEVSGQGDAYVWAVVQYGDPIGYEDLGAVPEELRAGIDAASLEEYSTIAPFFYMPMELLVSFDPPLKLRAAVPGRRFAGDIDFGADVEKVRQLGLPFSKVFQDGLQVALERFVAGPSPEALVDASSDDLRAFDRAMHVWFEAEFSGNDRVTDGSTSREDLVNAHVLLLRELASREVLSPEDDALAEESAAWKRDRFAPIHAGTPGTLEPLELTSLLSAYEKPMRIRDAAVCLVGSVCNDGLTRNDVDVLIRGPMDEETLHVIKFRLGRALEAEASRRLSFHHDAMGGPFTSFIKLYDLCLVPHEDRELKEMRLTAKADDPHLDWPAEPGKRRAVFQYHMRGRSLHGDLRMQVRDYLVGWTLALQQPDVMPSVTTVEQARAIADDFSVDGGRYNKPLLLPSRVFAEPKLRQPSSWLDVVGEVFGEGEVGATRNEKGVMVAVATPDVEWGLQKPFSHEYFLSGDPRLSGRLVFRLLVGDAAVDEGPEASQAPPGDAFWTVGLAKVVLPSVLTARAVETKSMPPLGHSAMPESLMVATPRKYRFWLEPTEAKARSVRDALVEARVFTERNVAVIDGEFALVEQKRAGAASVTKEIVSFVLTWQRFKGQTVVRGVGREVFHLIIGQPGERRVWDYQLHSDPLAGDPQVLALVREGGPELLSFDGDTPPGTRVGGIVLNPTKATPSHTTILESGTADVLDLEPGRLLRVRFDGEKLRGVHTLVAEEADGDIWLLAPGADPGRAVAKRYRMQGDVQVWDPADRSDSDDKGGDRDALRPPAIFAPTKPAARDANTFRDVEQAAHEALTDELVAAGVQVEPEWNGFRSIVQRWGDHGAMAYTEDSPDVNLLERWPSFQAELLALPGDIILDGEMMEAAEGGGYKPRRELADLRGNAPDDSALRFVVFDVLYASGTGNLTSAPLSERRSVLETWAKGHEMKHIVLGPAVVVRTRADMLDAMREAAAAPGSEGAMLKQVGSTISLGGENDLWAKVKLVRELRALVVARHEVEGSPGVYTFTGAIGPLRDGDGEWAETVEHGGDRWVVVGVTGNRKLDASVGDVIRVEALEFLHSDAVAHTLTWFGPAQALEVVDARPSTVGEALALLKPGEHAVAKAVRPVRLLKSDSPEAQTEERYVFGVVLVPDEVDAQGDIYDAATVRSAAHAFLEHFGGSMRIMHRGRPLDGIKVLESYVSKVAEVHGGEEFPVGTWFLATRAGPDEVWALVKEGSLDGYSIGGTALKEALGAAAKE
jgi:predicted nucleotidyltransferase